MQEQLETTTLAEANSGAPCGQVHSLVSGSFTAQGILKMRELATAWARAVTPAFQRCAKAMEVFGECWYKMAEKSYRQHHGKLPGSDKTKRLRKKRKKKVLERFTGQISIGR
jgi:hypothetical protein